ncbi:acyl-CoA N-acyltransferase [Chytriomyces sp. MP71]|nr:acyl-CoA N-acyltransferase [Chytriomyces sp. MP71]
MMRAPDEQPIDVAEVDDVDETNAAGASGSGASKKKKKRSKKNKASADIVLESEEPELETVKTGAGQPAVSVMQMPANMEGNTMEAKLQSLVQSLAKQGLFDQSEPRVDRTVLKPTNEYQFWKTQPVVRSEETVETDGFIDEDVPIDQLRQIPYDLQPQFEWTFVDVNNEDQLKETYILLSENYVEDKDSTFRFDYSREFLKWAIQPPGWKKQWHLGVRVKQSKKLVAFIAAIPSDVLIHGANLHLVDINFLCIHKKLRSKRLAPLLIKEITRLVNHEGIFQAAYTAGVALPKPFASCRYWHRSLNFKKLLDVGFSYLPRDQTMASMLRRLKLPTEAQVPGTRPMENRDVLAVQALLTEFLSIRCDVYANFSPDEIKHWFLPVKEVVYSYVVEDPESGKVTDFYSFYNLSSTILRNEKHNHLKAAYLFYYAPKGMAKDLNRTTAIMKDALIQALANDFDVFNCLDVMGNDRFLQELQFGKGDGCLNYYLYNYRCREVRPERLGLVLQ